MAFYGADVAELRALASTFQDRAAALDAMTGTLRAAVDGTNWAGPDAEELRARWHGEMEASLRSAALLLEDSAQALKLNAEQQDTASTSDGGTAGGPGAGGVTGSGARGTGGDQNPTTPPPPAEQAPAIVATDTYTFESSAGVGPLEGGTLIQYRVDELSDGTFRVTQIGGLSGGMGTGTPTPYAEGGINGHDVNVGGGAGASMGAMGNVGTEYAFETQQEVDDFVAYQQRQMQHGVGINGFDTYTPPEPVATIYEVGDYGTGTGGASIVPLAGGQADVRVEALAGVRYEESSGLTTVYTRGSATGDLSGQGVVPGNGGIGGPGVSAVTYDAKGNVVPNPPSSLVAPPPGGETTTVMDAGGSFSTPVPLVGGVGGGATAKHERTEYPQNE